MSPCDVILSARWSVEAYWLAYHRIDQFNTVIFRGVVACGDHDADRSIALLGPKTGDHADGEHDMVEPVGSVVQR